jgi:hypothetical protein
MQSYDLTDSVSPYLAVLSHEERTDWEDRLDRLHQACGCVEGGIGLIAALTGCLVFLFVQPGGILATRWQTIGVSLLIVIAAAVLGKCLGLWLARLKLRRAVTDLKRLVRSKGMSS